jgi:acyl-CoA thioester hydrolase
MNGGIGPDGWFRTRVPVRFRDLDAMGHAHHTLPLIYLEEARAAFWRDIKGGAADLASIDYVMAEVTLRFHARILFPSTVTVGLAVRHVGRSSFRTDFEVRDEAGTLLSSGSAAQVAYDYAAGRAKPLADADRARLESWRNAVDAVDPVDAAQARNEAMSADTSPMPPPST